MYLWIGKTLGGFHHWVIRMLMGSMPHRNREEACTYPHLEESMSEAGMQEVDN